MFDSNIKNKVPLLNLHNYEKWKEKIKNLLSLFDATDHITLNIKPNNKDEKEWINDDLSIKKILIDRISDENLKRSVANIITTLEIWLKLEKLFENKSSIDFFSKLNNFEIENNLYESIQELEKLFNEGKSFIDQLPNYRSYKLLNSLPSRYNDFRSKIYFDDNLDYEHVKNKLFDYDNNLANETSIQCVTIDDDDDVEDQNNKTQRQQNQIDNEIGEQQDQIIKDLFFIKSEETDNEINENGKRSLTDYDNSGDFKILKNEYIDMNTGNETFNINGLSQSSTDQSQLPQSTSQTQDISQITSALVGPKSMNGSYSFCDYNCNSNILDKKDLNKLDENNLKKLYFIGVLDNKILKSIKKFINLTDLQIQSTNYIENNFKKIKFNYNQLESFTFIANYIQFKIKLETKNLKMLCTNLKLNNLNLGRNQIKELHLLDDLTIDTEVKEIEKFKKIKILQLNNKITHKLFNHLIILKNKLICLNQICLNSLELEDKKLLNSLISFSDKESSPDIFYLSIRLNNQVKIDLNKSQLYNQLNNYKYLGDYSGLKEDVIDYNQLIDVLIELKIKLPNSFFEIYDSVNCVKFTNLIEIKKSDDIRRCLNFLDQMKNLSKMEVKITRNDDEQLFEKLIEKFKDRLVSLSIDIDNESKLDINLLSSLPKLSILEINRVLKNEELEKLKEFKNLEYLEFKRKINNDERMLKIIENDDEDGEPVFCLYIDTDYDDAILIDLNLKNLIKNIINDNFM